MLCVSREDVVESYSRGVSVSGSTDLILSIVNSDQ